MYIQHTHIRTQNEPQLTPHTLCKNKVGHLCKFTEKSVDLKLEEEMTDMTPKANLFKKINTLDLFKISNFCSVKNINRLKSQGGYI